MVELTKAELYKIDPALEGKRGGLVLKCPINPDAVKIAYSNQIEPAKADDKGGAAPGKKKGKAPVGGQFVSKLGTKLTVSLVLDVSALPAGAKKDVREQTLQVLTLLTPDSKTNAPPGVELVWGTLLFRGFLESVEESMELFSPDGAVLRSTLALTITRPALETGKNTGFTPSAGATRPGTKAPAAGTTPVSEAPAGGSVPGMVNQAKQSGGGFGPGTGPGSGVSVSWQDVAAANGIDDPLRLAAGQRLDLSAGARVKFGG
ncbi:MAG: hypothetical protein K2V38_26460 [Gemmataceae bacterium]|nr:hypothetical protein [Gemmataceae bacterium]